MADVIWNHENGEHRRAFALLLAPLVAVLWKKKEPFGVVEARTYMRTLKHVSQPILVAAVEKALAEQQWFPEPAVLLDYSAGIVAERRREAQAKWLTDCGVCHGSRWSEIEVDGVIRNERCECWKRMQVALSEIGQPIERPKLLTSGDPA